MRFLLLVAVLAFTIFSCKQKAICKTNCFPLPVSGKVIDVTTNKPVADVGLILFWNQSSAFSQDEKIVGKFRPNSDGTFKTIQNIDTTMWKKWDHLELGIGDDNYEYDIYYGPDEPHRKEIYLYKFHPAGFVNVTLLIRPKQSK